VAATPVSKFRLPPATLEALDALAACNGGVRTSALKDAVAYWHAAVAEAGERNALDLAPDDWTRLAHLNDPGDPSWLDEEDAGPRVIDWSARLAHELAGMWEGRAVVLPEHKDERKACRELARRIAGWGMVRGYALWACLRHFWTHPESGVGGGDWWHPATWMTPTARKSGEE